MLIYHARRDRLPAGTPFPSCTCGHCAAFSEPHACFASQPLAGQGPWVYYLEVPEDVLRAYEYDSPVGGAGTRHFAIPLTLLAEQSVAEVEYEALTRTDWRRWHILLKPRVPDVKNSWAQVWISRFGVALAKESVTSQGIVADVELTDLFRPEEDYVIVEHLYYQGNKFQYDLLAGASPPWANYLDQWHNWVNSKEIQDSAFQYIVNNFPSVTRDALYATKRTMKSDMVRAWQRVADEIGKEINDPLGRIPSGSWTSTMAMPIRIADRLSSKMSPAWTPPVPRPVFHAPDESGRILIATPDPERLRAGNPSSTTGNPGTARGGFANRP